MVVTDERNHRGKKEPIHPATDRKRRNAVSLGRNSSGCFCFQDIGSVPGKLPASRGTYWITDNLGMDRASTEGVYERREGRRSDGFECVSCTLFNSSIPCPLTQELFFLSLVVKSMKR